MKMMSEQTKKRIMKPVIDHLKKVDRFEKKQTWKACHSAKP
jgi:hypothetical protein